jgi:pimeloyl-ACP methyl ester carboxylesterase
MKGGRTLSRFALSIAKIHAEEETNANEKKNRIDVQSAFRVFFCYQYVVHMNLFFHVYGTGRPLVILHGLFGSSDNWHTVSKKLAGKFTVFAVDLRNHGRSPHSETMTFETMAQDMKEFMQQHNLPSAFFLGHSMGGKIAMRLALNDPQLVDALIVADIAPRKYPAQHDYIFDAILGLDLPRYSSRKEIDEALSGTIPSLATRQLVMKNLTRDQPGEFRWKMNLEAIRKNYDGINDAITAHDPFEKPTLFIRGARSAYIRPDDEEEIAKLFRSFHMKTIDNAGHWVHSDEPEEFVRSVLDFLEKQL